jgi:hypothetical protein
MRDDASRTGWPLAGKGRNGTGPGRRLGAAKAGLVIKQDQKPTLAFYGPDRRVVWYAPIPAERPAANAIVIFSPFC